MDRLVPVDYDDLLRKVLSDEISLEKAVEQILWVHGETVSNAFMAEVEHELRLRQ